MTKRPASSSGKQQRSTFSDPEPTLFGVPKSGPCSLLTGTAHLSANDFFWGFLINGQPIPPLGNGWLEKAETACPAAMTESSKERLRQIAETYLFQRFALLTSTSHLELTSTLHRIEKAAKALLEAIEIYGHDRVLAWRTLESVEPPTVKRDDVYQVITLLVRSAHMAAAQTKSQSDKTRSTFRPKKVWEDFAKGLFEIYAANNWSVKITKSQGSELIGTPHPSAFINFAWTVIDAIPPQLREHCSSPWTLADALHAVHETKSRGLGSHQP